MVSSTDIGHYIQTTLPQGQKGDGSTYYRCPVCDGNQKLEVHKNRTVWYCHKCARGGSLGNFVGSSGSVVIQDEGVNPSCPLLELERYALIGENSQHFYYLYTLRGLCVGLIQQLRPHKGPSRRRVYFPCYELGGTIPIYMVGRSLFDNYHPRYIYPAYGSFIYTKSEVLWGLHRITGPQEEVILCEGIFDAVMFSNGLALLGKTMSQPQAEWLKKINPKTITVVLDGDARSDVAQVAYTLMSTTSFNISVCYLPHNHDPGDMMKVEEYVKEHKEPYA